MVEKASPLRCPLHVLAHQFAGHNPSGSAGRVPLHINVHDSTTLTRHTEHGAPEIVGKLRYPRIVIGDPVLTDVVSILRKRAERLGKDSLDVHFRQLRAELTRQAIGQPGRVVHRDDDRTGPRSVGDAGHELSHAGHLRDRKDEMGIGKIQR